MPQPTNQAYPTAGRTFVAEFPTPNQNYKYLYCYLDSKIPGFEMPVYGDPHPDQENWTDYRVTLCQPDKQRGDEWWIVVYAKDMASADQDAWNYQVEYPFGDTSFPDYVRTYILPRASYFGLNGETATGPLALGTADPGFGGAVLIEGDKVFSATDDPVLDSLYVKVVRRFGTLPGPYILREETDAETQTGVIITSQRVATPSFPVSLSRGSFVCASNTFTQAKHGLVNGMCVTRNGSSTNYFVIGATTNTLQLSTTSGGSAASISDATYTLTMGPGTDCDYQPTNTYYGMKVFKTLVAWDAISRVEYETGSFSTPAAITGLPTGTLFEAWDGTTNYTLNWGSRRAAQSLNCTHRITTTYGPLASLSLETLFNFITNDLIYDGNFYNVNQHRVLNAAITSGQIRATSGTDNPVWPYIVEDFTATASDPTSIPTGQYKIIGSPIKQWKYPGLFIKKKIEVLVV